MRVIICTIVAAALSANLMGQSLPEGRWGLVSYVFNGKAGKPLTKKQTKLVIRDDGKLGGTSGCNAYGGEYAVEDGKLKVSGVISTMMACEEPTPAFETNYFRTLNNATSFAINKDSLILTDPTTGDVLRFAKIKDDK
ncbi:MAG: META domain-containing protein [Acidobacteria bacterium]|nr:META domain-containing protein [Acidobacteriota bacterium]